jgi:hypothetical protein
MSSESIKTRRLHVRIEDIESLLATAAQKDILGMQHHPKTVAQLQPKCVDTPRTPQTTTSCAG